jgi:hypothetical protein
LFHLTVLECLDLLSILIFLGNGAPEGNIFKEIQEKKKRKKAPLNILEPLISLEMRFQVFQGIKRTNKLFSRPMMFS